MAVPYLVHGHFMYGHSFDSYSNILDFGYECPSYSGVINDFMELRKFLWTDYLVYTDKKMYFHLINKGTEYYLLAASYEIVERSDIKNTTTWIKIIDQELIDYTVKLHSQALQRKIDYYEDKLLYTDFIINKKSITKEIRTLKYASNICSIDT